MTKLIDRKTRLRILKKNNKLMYKLEVFNIKSDKYIYLMAILLGLYIIFRIFMSKKENLNNINTRKKKVNINDENEIDNKYNNNYNNKYLYNYSQMENKIYPKPPEVINI